MKSNKRFPYECLLPVEGTTTRYVRLPLDLLIKCLDNSTVESTPTDAFIQILRNVNFRDDSNESEFMGHTCRKGESFRSLQAWSDIFRWNKSKTRRYFQQLERHRIIELENMGYTTRIRVLHYEYYTGKVTHSAEKPYPEGFERLWEAYHKTTQTAAVDKLPAFREWRKLSTFEREKAIQKISSYYYSLSKTTFCAKAVTYLYDKKFNNQFYY